MKVLGLDLSTKSSGYCIMTNNREEMQWGFITATSTDVFSRITKITQELELIIDNNLDIDKILLEEVIPKASDSSSSKNLHTQKVLMWLQGSVLGMLHKKLPKAEIVYVYPSEWRSKCNIQTGRGIKRLTLKEADIEYVRKTFTIEPQNDDEADAICIANSAFITNSAPSDLNWG